MMKRLPSCAQAEESALQCVRRLFAPIRSADTQDRPTDNRRKNSFKSNPAIDRLMRSWTPDRETSSIVQSRRQVPSIPMIIVAALKRYPIGSSASPRHDAILALLQTLARTSTRLESQATETWATSTSVAGWFPGSAKNEAFFERLPSTARHSPFQSGPAAIVGPGREKISSAGWRLRSAT